MNHPMIIDRPLSVRDQITEALEALDFGFEPADGSSESQRDEAAANREAVARAITAVRNAKSDREAQKAALALAKQLFGIGRWRIASGWLKRGVK